MHKKEMINARMVFAFIIVLALSGKVSGVCEDDLVPLEPQNFPVVWNIGTVPHLFVNSVHLRGAIAVRDKRILGLDTVTTSLHFCASNMTIYGNLTARGIEFVGSYRSNLDFINEGSQTFIHGDGEFDLILTPFKLTSIVAPLQYSRVTKKLQMDQMQYEVIEDSSKTKFVTGLQADGQGDHFMDNAEFQQIEQSNSFPTYVEFIRAVINHKAPKGLLPTIANQIFEGALSH